MQPLWRRWRRGFYHLLSLQLLGLARVAPAPLGRAACRALARAALRWRPVEAARARANLAVAFPELGEPDRRRILADAAAALGGNLWDALTVPRVAARGFPDVADDGAIDEARSLLAQGRGLLILTGHIGCWELLGAYLASRLNGLTVVTGTIHNPPVDRLVNRRRVRLGLTPVAREGDLRPLLRALRRGGAVAVLLDQNTRVENRDVPFFGRPAPTPTGFARLALRTGAPVLPVAIGRDGRGHRVVHLPPLRAAGETEPDAVYSLLKECNRALESLIRRRPAEWVWFHERWRAGGAAERN
jgi:KDO2-lipid IV(A) lauroyltransferase